MLLSHPNRQNYGESVSRMAGLEKASGNYIAFLDSDDLFHPYKLERQAADLDAHPEVVLCHTAVDVIGDTSMAAYFKAAFNTNPTSPYSFRRDKDYLLRNRICNSSTLMRADALRAVPFATIAINGYQDWLCWCLIAAHGKFLFLEDPLTIYRVHGKSITAERVNNRLLRHYALLEMKIALIARSESTWHSLRSLLSTLETLRVLVVEYLWVPSNGNMSQASVRKTFAVRALMVPSKLIRWLRPHHR
jgi:glycosyltransferase involved in cell wall biosynthesis